MHNFSQRESCPLCYSKFQPITPTEQDPMRIAIIADIHANYQALQAVLADIDRQNIDEIISLGDNVGYGPQPDEVVKELIARDIFSIIGNHELGLHTFFHQ